MTKSSKTGMSLLELMFADPLFAIGILLVFSGVAAGVLTTVESIFTQRVVITEDGFKEFGAVEVIDLREKEEEAEQE